MWYTPKAVAQHTIPEVRIIWALRTGLRATVAASLIAVELVWFTMIGMLLPLLLGFSILVYEVALFAVGELKFHEVTRGWDL